MKYGSDKKMKDDMNPKRMKKAYGGDARTGYKKGSKVEMHKCMPN